MKTALRPTKYSPRVSSPHIECESLERVRDRQDGARLGAQDHMPAGLPARQQRLESQRRAYVGNSQALALFGGLDRVGPQAIDIEPGCDRSPRDHRLKGCDAELGSLLDQEIDRVLLQRREA